MITMTVSLFAIASYHIVIGAKKAIGELLGIETKTEIIKLKKWKK